MVSTSISYPMIAISYNNGRYNLQLIHNVTKDLTKLGLYQAKNISLLNLRNGKLILRLVKSSTADFNQSVMLQTKLINGEYFKIIIGQKTYTLKKRDFYFVGNSGMGLHQLIVNPPMVFHNEQLSQFLLVESRPNSPTVYSFFDKNSTKKKILNYKEDNYYLNLLNKKKFEFENNIHFIYSLVSNIDKVEITLDQLRSPVNDIAIEVEGKIKKERFHQANDSNTMVFESCKELVCKRIIRFMPHSYSLNDNKESYIFQLEPGQLEYIVMNVKNEERISKTKKILYPKNIYNQFRFVQGNKKVYKFTERKYY